MQRVEAVPVPAQARDGSHLGPIEIAGTDLVFGVRSVEGSLTGSTSDCERTLSFTASCKTAPIIEKMPLDEAPVAFAKMMDGRANMRIVLVMN